MDTALAKRPCGNCGTRTSVHGPDCLGDQQPCDRCKKVHDREELDIAFVCEFCRIVESIENGVGPSAEMIAEKIESLGKIAGKGTGRFDLSKVNLVRNTLLWMAGHSRWDQDVFGKLKA